MIFIILYKHIILLDKYNEWDFILILILLWKPFIMILIMKNKSYLIQKINNILCEKQLKVLKLISMINCLEPPISLSENPLCGFELRY